MITYKKLLSCGAHSFAKGAVVFLSVALMQTVCEAKNNLKNIAETYRGDGVASYLKKPAFLASDGVRVDFETFSLSEGFNKELLISGLPPVKHNRYDLHFCVDKELGEDIAENIFIDMVLKDENGTIIWSLNSSLRSWRTGTERRDFSYLSYNYEDDTGLLVPDENTNYTLRIHCWVKEATGKTVDRKAHFFLRAGGYK